MALMYDKNEKQNLSRKILNKLKTNLGVLKKALGLKTSEPLPESLRMRIDLGRRLVENGKPEEAIAQLQPVYLLMCGLVPRKGGIPIKRFNPV